MSEDSAESEGRSTAVAVRPQRQLVADVVPIFDSARFEHYGRIAAVMAQSTLVPATLRAGQRDEAIANCIQVVEFADRAGYSPFAVAQCASVVHGKLMFEGKLVDAMLQTKLGIELNCYYTGERGKDDRRIYVTDATLTEAQYAALEPGKYPFGIRMIDGSILEWRTYEKNSTNPAKAWTGQQSEMQLAYKGKRTWSRMFRPSVMLGVLTDDEVQDFDERRLEPAEPAQLLAAPGFDAAKAARRPRKPKDGQTTDDAGQAAEAPTASGDAQRDAEFEEGEFEDNCEHAWEAVEGSDEEVCGVCGMVRERPTTPAADTATAGVPPAEGEPATPASAATAPEASRAPTDSSPPTASEPTGPGSSAPRDTVYVLTGAELGEDGKVETFKNGQPFSRAKLDGKAPPPVFDHHPQDEGAAGEAEFEEERDAPADDEEAIFAQALSDIRAAPHFLAAKQAQRNLSKTDAYAVATLERKAGVRLALWKRYAELYDEKVETIQPYEDFTLMRMFLEFGATSEADIDGMWPQYWRHAAYKDASDGDKRAMNDLMLRRKAELKEGQ